MITLKIGKAICPVCDVKNSNSVSSVSGKLTTLGLFFAANKDLTSSSIDGVIRKVLNFLFFFYDKISQALKSTKKHNQYIVFFQDKILSTLNTLVFVQGKILYQMLP